MKAATGVTAFDSKCSTQQHHTNSRSEVFREQAEASVSFKWLGVSLKLAEHKGSRGRPGPTRKLTFLWSPQSFFCHQKETRIEVEASSEWGDVFVPFRTSIDLSFEQDNCLQVRIVFFCELEPQTPHKDCESGSTKRLRPLTPKDP